MNEEITTVQTVHDLRHRWKPRKERLAALGGEQPTSIRFHREAHCQDSRSPYWNIGSNLAFAGKWEAVSQAEQG